MGLTLSRDNLRELYSLMQAEPPAHPRTSPAILKEIARTGWAFSWQAEDLFSMADRRLDDYSHHFDFDELATALGARKQHVGTRPRSITRCVNLLDAWSAMDFAGLLIDLESLGFKVDPAPLVDMLLPTIPKKGYITGSALHLLWFERYRFKRTITLKAAESGRGREFKDHKLPGGYKLEALIDVDGNPASLTVTGPKYRRTKEPVQVNCECGHTWYRGDPESSLAHRKEHKRRMSYLEPQPHPKVIEERAGGAFDEHVDRGSAEWRNDEVYSRALAFKREKKYDFVQWSTREDDPNVHGFLFTDDDGRIVGSCAFRYRIYPDVPPRWGLQWVWIAPPHRRQGILASRWAEFRQRFGDFDVESPISNEMAAFLTKAGDDHLVNLKNPKTLGSQVLVDYKKRH